METTPILQILVEVISSHAPMATLTTWYDDIFLKNVIDCMRSQNNYWKLEDRNALLKGQCLTRQRIGAIFAKMFILAMPIRTTSSVQIQLPPRCQSNLPLPSGQPPSNR